MKKFSHNYLKPVQISVNRVKNTKSFFLIYISSFLVKRFLFDFGFASLYGVKRLSKRLMLNVKELEKCKISTTFCA